MIDPDISDRIRSFYDTGWVYDPDTRTVRLRRIRGMATPRSDEEFDALNRIRELRDLEEATLLPAPERARAERRLRLWGIGKGTATPHPDL